MGIINRTLDESEQQESLKGNHSTVVNTNERQVAIIERACVIQKVRSTCTGISGAPTAMLRVFRSGGTTFNVGLTFLVPAFGVSGAMAALSLPASGSTQLNLQKDDLVSVIYGGGTGAAFDHGTVDIVVKNIQDIKTWY